MGSNIIDIPPAVDYTLDPDKPTFSFNVSSACTACFGTATPKGSFPGLEDKNLSWEASSQHTFPIPIVADASLPYCTAGPNATCDPSPLSDTGKVIVIGDGLALSGSKARKPAKKTESKSAVKKGTGVSKKTAPAKKKAAKKAAPKKAAKTAPKKAAKKAGKKAAKKTATKSKPKTKAKAKKGKSRR